MFGWSALRRERPAHHAPRTAGPLARVDRAKFGMLGQPRTQHHGPWMSLGERGTRHVCHGTRQRAAGQCDDDDVYVMQLSESTAAFQPPWEPS